MRAWTPVVVGVLVVSALAACTSDSDEPRSVATASGAPASPSQHASPTSAPRRGPLALTVSADGPPASLVGLDRARAVVEYPVAADRTGLLVVLETDAEVVGPLRSATPSDATLALASGADLVTGMTTGSVVEQLRQAELSVVEEFTLPGTLVRDPARRAPFNLYAVPSRVREAVGERPAGLGWPAGASQTGTPRPQSEVHVTTTGDLAVTWTWDPAAQRWLRTAAGQLEQSATGERIGADTVVVLEVPVRDRPPVVADLVGSGSALVLRDGTVTDTRWQRDDETELPSIEGLDGSAAAGRTLWLHVCASPCT